MAKYKGQIREKLTEYQKLGFKQGGKGDPASEANSLDMHEAKIYADAERYVTSRIRF